MGFGKQVDMPVAGGLVAVLLEGVGQAVALIAALLVPELLLLLLAPRPGRTLVLSSTPTWKLRVAAREASFEHTKMRVPGYAVLPDFTLVSLG